jgi:hypothetical protein
VCEFRTLESLRGLYHSVSKNLTPALVVQKSSITEVWKEKNWQEFAMFIYNQKTLLIQGLSKRYYAGSILYRDIDILVTQLIKKFQAEGIVFHALEKVQMCSSNRRIHFQLVLGLEEFFYAQNQYLFSCPPSPQKTYPKKTKNQVKGADIQI